MGFVGLVVVVCFGCVLIASFWGWWLVCVLRICCLVGVVY